jgi:hypothetical protein
MRTHELKVSTNTYERIASGEQTFLTTSLRKIDFQVGDALRLLEWAEMIDGTHVTKDGRSWGYSGRDAVRYVTYVGTSDHVQGVSTDHVVLALAAR